MSKFVTYIATRVKSELEVMNDKHITLAFADTQATSKLEVGSLSLGVSGCITEVVYWSHVDLTVALVDSSLLCELQTRLSAGGFKYDYEFLPHITLGKGDLTSENKNIEGNSIGFKTPYIQIKEKK